MKNNGARQLNIHYKR
uniref:Uncharacterized protein n=1 Tax=Anguilla anguilla TaxID=7936 RepID=A0A0E9TL04_ANGAN